MSAVNSDNRLSAMLDNAFAKVDRNKDGQLDAQEYKSFYEVLRAGIAVDQNDVAKISDGEYFQRMDHNADGGVTREEMQSTPVLMRADLCDPSLDAMIGWLKDQSTAAASLAARYLAADDASGTSTKNG
jgi:Ca2+-binding EF-hand superfamily protein